MLLGSSCPTDHLALEKLVSRARLRRKKKFRRRLFFCCFMFQGWAGKGGYCQGQGVAIAVYLFFAFSVLWAMYVCFSWYSAKTI